MVVYSLVLRQKGFDLSVMRDKEKYFFVGIGGTGMNPLAQILKQRGNWVGGSDRSNDRNLNRELFSKLKREGIDLFPQSDGVLPEDINRVVVTTAVENSIGQIQTAKSLNIEIVHRSELLAELFNKSFGVGVAGTSGKTTVTAMIVSVLKTADYDPTFVNGGIIKQFENEQNIGNAGYGKSQYFVAEIDESDGSIVNFSPKIGVITNITKDHKEMDELIGLFRGFSEKTTGYLILNGDCKNISSIAPSNSCFFGLSTQNHIRPSKFEIFVRETRFVLNGVEFNIYVPGVHNLYNSLAAVAVCLKLGIPLGVIKEGLEQFKGIKRRLDIKGEAGGVTVIDDFAHNSDKVSASLSAIQQMGCRIFVVFQPHGYGPTKFLMKELSDSFSNGLKKDDFFLCLDIFDAGGTADRTITSENLVRSVKGTNALYVKDRQQALSFIKNRSCKGDIVVVMGARDDTLSLFAEKILRELTKKKD